MDKYDIVLDIIGHPEKYSEEQLKEMLADQETREIYNLLCTTVSAAGTRKDVDIEAQWQAFSRRRLPKRRRLPWLGSRAAAIAALIVTSLMAVAIGLMVSVSRGGRQPSAVAVKTGDGVEETPATMADTVAAEPDSIRQSASPVLFEDASLQTIMEAIAKAYHVEVRFNNKAVAALHLYYKLDTTQPLDEIIKQLNTFGQISIARTGNTLTLN